MSHSCDVVSWKLEKPHVPHFSYSRERRKVETNQLEDNTNTRILNPVLLAYNDMWFSHGTLFSIWQTKKMVQEQLMTWSLLTRERYWKTTGHLLSPDFHLNSQEVLSLCMLLCALLFQTKTMVIQQCNYVSLHLNTFVDTRFNTFVVTLYLHFNKYNFRSKMVCIRLSFSPVFQNSSIER